jgi:hypothetical protein
VTQALIDVVRVNNSKDSPFLPEVEAAFTSLIRHGTEASQAFLEEVLHRRRFLISHAYRSDFRKILASLLATRRDSRCRW